VVGSNGIAAWRPVSCFPPNPVPSEYAPPDIWFTIVRSAFSMRASRSIWRSLPELIRFSSPLMRTAHAACFHGNVADVSTSCAFTGSWSYPVYQVKFPFSCVADLLEDDGAAGDGLDVALLGEAEVQRVVLA
jgi:hypothetical protein